MVKMVNMVNMVNKVNKVNVENKVDVVDMDAVSGCFRWMYPDDVSKCVRLKYIYVYIMYPDLST